jgi:transcriptional regulator with XRE-family HTH domain
MSSKFFLTEVKILLMIKTMNLKEYLTAENISQNRAAKELGQTRQHIGGIVNGSSLPGRALIKKMVTWSKGKITFRDSRPDWAEIADL